MSKEETHDLEKLGAQWAADTASDLSGLFGVDVSVTGPSLQQADRDALLGKSGAIVCSRCEVEEEDGAPFWLVLPLRGALVLAAAQAGKSPEEFDAIESSGFEGEIADAYGGAIDICAGVLGRILDEEAGLPAIKLCESRAIDSPKTDDGLPNESFRCARFEFEVTGFPKQRLDLFFNTDLATRWFGEMERSEDGTSDQGVDLRIAVIDPSEESREAFEQIAEELGAQILSIDPAELGHETIEELAEVDLVVLCWDIGGLSGLEFLDRLRGDETTSHLAFAIASPGPTRAMVEAALRWGARTVLYQPWQAEEIGKWFRDPT